MAVETGMRRFWTEARVEPVAEGFAVRLDGRPVKTPGKRPLVLPTQAMAEAVAAEWQAQGARVAPATMPMTRCGNTGLDKMGTHHAEVAAMLADYGGSDLLCYRAEAPAALIARQETAWDPVLAWAADVLHAPLVATRGVMHVAQPAASLMAIRRAMLAFNPYELVGVHDLVAISGSALLALAVTRDHLSAEAAWTASRIDETWQAELWGQDDEAVASEARRRADFFAAERFFRLSR